MDVLFEYKTCDDENSVCFSKKQSVLENQPHLYLSDSNVWQQHHKESDWPLLTGLAEITVTELTVLAKI